MGNGGGCWRRRSPAGKFPGGRQPVILPTRDLSALGRTMAAGRCPWFWAQAADPVGVLLARRILDASHPRRCGSRGTDVSS